MCMFVNLVHNIRESKLLVEYVLSEETVLLNDFTLLR